MTGDLAIWKYLLPGITFGLAAAAQPGPLMLYLVSNTLRSGWKKTFPAIFAPLISDGPIAVVCLLVLGTLPDAFLNYIRIAGGVFILWLAYGSARAWWTRKTASQEAGMPEGRGRTLISATVVNFLNPGPYIGWSLLVGPLFIQGWRQAPGNGIAILAGFYLTMFLVSGLIIFFVDKANERVPKLQRLLLGLSALGLAAMGIYQLVTGLIS